MTTYIALLRGINVSGHNIIKMVTLKKLFFGLGYQDVITYIQSGNVIFKSNLKESFLTIQDTIISAISKQFGYTVNVLVLNKSELLTIYNSNPFLAKDAAMDISKLHVTLLNTEPDMSKKHHIEELVLESADEFIIQGKNVFLHCPNGQAKTKLTTNLFEKKLNSSATTRNWKTITKLTELSFN
jgi:uncharacterized protein (DUF1697 family)